MLKEILSITGKPGLFKIIAHNGKTLIVEDLVTEKRFPVSPRDRVVSLGDIAMYTEESDRPLGEILEEIHTKENGKPIDVKALVATKGLKERFESYVPDYDKERVHDSDIKKLFTWYNLLVDKGFTKFVEEEKEDEERKETAKEDKASNDKVENKAPEKKEEASK